MKLTSWWSHTHRCLKRFGLRSSIWGFGAKVFLFPLNIACCKNLRYHNAREKKKSCESSLFQSVTGRESEIGLEEYVQRATHAKFSKPREHIVQSHVSRRNSKRKRLLFVTCLEPRPSRASPSNNGRHARSCQNEEALQCHHSRRPIRDETRPDGVVGTMPWQRGHILCSIWSHTSRRLHNAKDLISLPLTTLGRTRGPDPMAAGAGSLLLPLLGPALLHVVTVVLLRWICIVHRRVSVASSRSDENSLWAATLENDWQPSPDPEP